MDREQLEKMTREYNALHEQLQNLALQREQLAAQKADLEGAQKEIEAGKGKVYLAIGGAIVETEREKAMRDIKERLESSEMRAGIVKRQYDELSKKEQSLRAEITAALKESKG
jgi:prefoldin beta subunit